MNETGPQPEVSTPPSSAEKPSAALAELKAETSEAVAQTPEVAAEVVAAAPAEALDNAEARADELVAATLREGQPLLARLERSIAANVAVGRSSELQVT